MKGMKLLTTWAFSTMKFAPRDPWTSWLLVRCESDEMQEGKYHLLFFFLLQQLDYFEISKAKLQKFQIRLKRFRDQTDGIA